MKAVVLSSGGIDSTVLLTEAVARYGAAEVLALTMLYGQKHSKELDAAKAVAERLGVQHLVRDLSSTFEFSDCPLLQGRGDMVHASYAEQLEAMGGSGTVATYVPFRNGLFLAYAAAIAYSFGAEVVFYGAHADDAAGRAYPDCTPEFYGAMNDAVSQGTGLKVRLAAPLLHMNKTSIVALGLELGAPFELTWSCYEGSEEACGTCGTCLDRRAAFLKCNTVDPIKYANSID